MTASPISSSMPAPALVSGRGSIARVTRQGESEAAHSDPPEDFRQAFREQIADSGEKQPAQQRPTNSQTNSKASTSRGTPQQQPAGKAAPAPKKDDRPNANAQPVEAIELSATAASTLQPQTPDGATAPPVEVQQQAAGEQTAGAGAIGAIPVSSAAKGDPALAVQIKTVRSDAGDESATEAADEQSQSARGPDLFAAQTMAANLPTRPQAGDDAKDSRGEDAQQHHDNDSTPQSPALPFNALHNQTASGTGDVSKTDAATGTHDAAFEAELTKAHPQPVRGAQIQITGSENQRVDIRMMERNGTLSLTVRSADHALSKALQEHAPELDARLAAEHYRTEMWTPTAAKSSDTRDLAKGNRQGSGGNGAPSGNNSSGQGRQGRKDNGQPAWLESFEDQAKTIQHRIEYTWHQ